MKNIKKFNRLIQLLRIKPEFSKEITSRRLNGDWIIGIDIRTKDILEENGQLREYMIRTILHEIGHFMVAPSGRRFKKDFGIRTNKRSNEEHWDIDELKAQFVENDFLKFFGMKIRPSRLLMKNYGSIVKPWYEKEGKNLAKQLLDLVP